jgi:phosphoglycerol geranylgeranyltransferase
MKGIGIGKVEQLFEDIAQQRGGVLAVLLDPDSNSPASFHSAAAFAVKGGADVLLVGGSFMGTAHFTAMIQSLKKEFQIPVVLFPGGAGQVMPGPDAILFTSLVSGRNPQYLIEQQIQGGVFVKGMGMEAIPTAYCLIDGGQTTAVEYISNTRPIPADKPKISMVTAIGAELMGMRWIYLEAGSGAKNPVPLEHIALVKTATNLGIIAGGGLVNPNLAAQRIQAGASVIVTGTIWEKQQDTELFKEFAAAIHAKG